MSRNTYVWDWAQVRRLCPEYDKYLVRADGQYELEPRTIAIANGAIVDDDIAVIAPQAVAIPQQAVADDEILPAGYNRKYSDLSEEEQAIVREMHELNKSKPKAAVTVDTADDGLIAELAEEGESVEDAVYDDTEYKLRSEYANNPIAIIPTVLLLPPPKSVLGHGSEVWDGDRTIYHVWVDNRGMSNPNIVELRQNKIYYNKTKGIVGLVKHTYRFNRLTNSVSEMKKETKMTTYNTRTNKLYYISYLKNGTKRSSRFNRIIKQMSLNHTGFESSIHGFNSDLTDRFVAAILESTIKLVPDMYLPPVKPYHTMVVRCIPYPAGIIHDQLHSQDRLYATFCASLQARVGKRLEWLSNKTLMLNISEFVKVEGLIDKLYGREYVRGLMDKGKDLAEYRKADKNLRKNTYYKTVTNLKKDPSQKSLLKSLFGKFYKNIYGSIFANEDDKLLYSNTAARLVCQLIQTSHMEVLPTRLYHYFVHAYDKRDLHGMDTCMDIMTDLASLKKDDVDKKKSVHNVIDLYLNIKDRLDCNVEWHMFRDIMDMANDLSIRIRINKIKDFSELRYVHDKLTEYQRRNAMVVHDYEGVTFHEYVSPTDMYDDFEFIQLRTAQELVEEGTTMHHCVGGYSYRCVEGTSIIYSMRKNGRGYVTIEVDGTNLVGDIRQQYTIGDYTVNNGTITNIITKWKKDLDRLHRDDTSTYQEESTKVYREHTIKIEMDKIQKELAENMETEGTDTDLNTSIVLSEVELLKIRLTSLSKQLSELMGGLCQDEPTKAPAW